MSDFMIQEILPVLLKMIDTLSSPKEPQSPAGPDQKQGQTNTTLIKVASTKHPLETGQETEALPRTQSSNPTATFPCIPVFIPLPFKSPSFPEGNFYLVQNRSEGGREVEKKEITLLISLKTASLGLLRIFLVHREEKLLLHWMTQSPVTRILLEKSFPELEAEMLKLGYEQVAFSLSSLAGSKEINPHQEPFFNLYI